MAIQHRPLTAPEQVERARHLAHVMHADHVNDKNGEDYLAHPERVASHAARLIAEEKLNQDESASVLAAAWLHDTVEDTELTLDDLRRYRFPEEVVSLVGLLTRDVSDEEYYERIRGHRLALLTKLADLADNADPERLKVLDQTAQSRLTAKYAHAYAALGVRPPAHLTAN